MKQLKSMRQLFLFGLLTAGLSAGMIGCNSKKADSGPNSAENPAGVGETMVYDGMKALKERNRFTAEITLEDVVRGDEAEEIFNLASDSDIGSEYGPEMEDDQEFLAAKFKFEIKDTAEDMAVELETRASSMFNLVSETGTSYEEFYVLRYVGRNLFRDAYKGSSQTGYLFYLVDVDDQNPNIVFLPSVDGGVWFKTTLDEEDEERVSDPIDEEEWEGTSDDSDFSDEEDSGKKAGAKADKGRDAQTAGALSAPLPLGEYGYMKVSDTFEGSYELEMAVEEILRGEEAAGKYRELDPYQYDPISQDQEIMLVKVRINMPSGKLEDDRFGIYDSDFGLVNTSSGIAYDRESRINLIESEPGYLLEGGTTEGWVGYVLEDGDQFPLFYYAGDNEKLYFSTDPSYKLPGDVKVKDSEYTTMDPIRDSHADKGNWKNPYLTGEEVQLSYKPRFESSYDVPFKGSITILEAYRGDAALSYLNEESYLESGYSNLEPVLIKLRVKVDQVEGNDAPRFSASDFSVISGRGGEVRIKSIPSYNLTEKALDEVYPGGEAEGYIAFLMDQSVRNIEISYGSIDPVGIWMEAQFSGGEQPPGDDEI